MAVTGAVAAGNRPLRWPAVAGALAGASAVLLGAFGAHALQGDVPARALEIWQTANRFQFWHALALFACVLPGGRPRERRAAALLFACGIVLFAGSLYALALGAPRAFGFVTPLGGIALFSGWVALGVAFLRNG